MSIFNVTMACIAEIFGDFSLKDYAREDNKIDLIKGLLGYAGVIYFLIRSLAQANIIYVNGMWDGISGIVETIAAYFILKEKLNTKEQYFGLGLLMIGLFIFRAGGIARG